MYIMVGLAMCFVDLVVGFGEVVLTACVWEKKICFLCLLGFVENMLFGWIPCGTPFLACKQTLNLIFGGVNILWTICNHNVA